MNGKKSRDAAIRRASDQTRKGIIVRRGDTKQPDEKIHVIHKQRGINHYLFRCVCGRCDMTRLESVDHITNVARDKR